MIARPKRLICVFTLCSAGLAACLLARRPSAAGDAKPAPLESRIVGWEEARSHVADWGEMRFYFTGETAATKDVLVAAAVVEPGEAVHRAHRHAQEEYLIVVQGSGTWSLAGEESPAKKGDVLYAEPWVYHGLVNTGDEPLIFAVVRYNGKGAPVPPRPDDQPDER